MRRSIGPVLGFSLLLAGCGSTAPQGDGGLPVDLSGQPSGDLPGSPPDLAKPIETFDFAIDPGDGPGEFDAGLDAEGGEDLAAGDSGGGVDAPAPAGDLAAPQSDALLPCNQRCANGCCQNEVCLPSSPQVGCATMGGACAPCPAEADTCLNGVCSCGNTGAPCGPGLECMGGACKCSAKSCPGCCANATTCVANPTAAQCGSAGGACVNCAPSGNTCFQGKCQCNAGPPCGMNATCDNQMDCVCPANSCRANGGCTPVGVANCGTPGNPCVACDPRKANRCDGGAGECRCGANPACKAGYYCDVTNVPTCLCDPTANTGCPGCCSKDRLTCFEMQTDNRCGLDGATCADCAQMGGTCNQNAGACTSCAKTCLNGCCTGNVCTPINNQTGMTGCGTGGGACVQCGIDADGCANGGCSCGGGKACAAGLQCITGQCVCTKKACPNGCCGLGGCMTIGVANCGLPGDVCMACDAKIADRCLQGNCSCGAGGKVCAAGQRCANGACVCDAQSCPNGCCGGNQCNGISLSNCGKPGGACVTCDVKTADKCTNGACLCGVNPPCGQGLVCVGGTCRCATNPCDSCATAAAAKSYVGCEYWPTVTFQGAWSIFDFAVAVANPQKVAATITTTGPNNFNNVTTVQPGQLAKVYLPWVASLKGPDMDSCGRVTATTQSVMARGGAYKVVSSVPVSVYQFSPIEYRGTGGPQGKSWAQCPGTVQRCSGGPPIGCFSFTNDASLLVPKTAMTGNYRVAGLNGWTISGTPLIGAFAAITGTTNNTQVTISLSQTARIVASSGNVIPAANAGAQVKLTLNAGDVAQLLTPLGAAYDLSGSLVAANQPVQVITGNQCVNVPAASGYCDHIEESVLPAETLGKRYAVTVPTGPKGSPVGHVVRIYGNFANTKLTYDPAPLSASAAPATIQPGRVYDLGRTRNDFVVTGDQPFVVESFQLGSSIVDPNTPAPNQQGDPSQSQMVAIEQYRNQYIFLATSDYSVSYADLVVPMGAQVTLDGVVQGAAPVPMGGSGFGVLRIRLGAGNQGAHTITSSAPVGVQVMGYGSYTSYQYPGGLDLNLISQKPVDF